MKSSQKQVSRLKNTKNKKVSAKKVLKLVKSVSKTRLSRTLKSTKSTKSKTNTINIKENEYTITYNTYLKYPEFVIEPINVKTGTTLQGQVIDRSKFVDPFLPSPKVDFNKQHTWGTYLNSMFYGFSPGHNAPAGNHKTDQSTYLKTFQLTNMCPQEMVFNSGLWVVFENWSKDLAKNKNLYDINIITGSSKNFDIKSIPTLPEDYFYKLFEGNNLISEDMIKEYQKSKKQNIKVPKSMFKIVTCRHRALDDNTILYIILDADNKPFYFREGSEPIVDTRGKDKMKLNLKPFSISIKTFNNKYKTNFINLIKSVYSRQKNKIKFDKISNHIACKYYFPFLIELQMKKSYWYGKMIYAKNMKELEDNWEKLQELKERFRDLQYHRQFYLLRKLMLSKRIQ